VAGGKERQALVVEDREIKDYERIRRRLVREKRTAAQQRREISTQKAQAQTAQNELNAATTRDARLVAEANLLKEQLDVAQACTNGTISAIDNVFSATSATAGVKRLNSDLNALSADCKETVG
jgi:chromosome segregation ATPase